ncbi:MAG: formylmethanofuran dehydrogenase subunit A [Candidatus Lokiarchaeota archaeon]|nr:formylmethanofuran dehydrogenase subunit A [Candidatus Lokiarchaeota archaeon]MBD3199445.1 formylmethanofuran dehydrogenase subunit A [Candidatus Lokiarchaeota archaeon]
MKNSITIKNGIVYDPLNDGEGEKKDIHIVGGIVSEKADPDAKVIDASGMIVMPGGVDVHTHIAGAKVNHGRAFRPEDHVIDQVKKTKTTRAGTGYSVPSTWVTGYRYAKLGYTTAVEPAMPLLEARHTHEEFLATPILDKAAFPLFGNNWYVMEFIRNKEWDKLAGYVAWILKATKGYAIKIVNPGGVENWAWGKNVDSLDSKVFHWGVTPRQILEGLAKANELLGLPHSIHIHANNLGHPGNASYTIDTWKALEGIEPKTDREPIVHLTHCQFNAYGGSNWGNFASGAADIANYINSHKHVTIDMGQVVFAKAATTTMTADGPWEFALHHLSGMSPWGAKPGVKWINGQVEGESGSGIVPYYFDPKVGVNAIQWAIGLELALLVDDPYKIFMTTDHPNGGPFIYYPKILRWLMDKKSRDEMLDSVSSKADSQTQLRDIDRELTLNEICIMTRAGTAKSLGMNDRGHLGIGAIGDVSVYNLDPSKMEGHSIEKAFSNAKYTIKDGQIVVKDGEIVASPMGTTICAEGKIKDSVYEATLDAVKYHWRDHYSINFNNYEIGDHYTPKMKIVNGA